MCRMIVSVTKSQHDPTIFTSLEEMSHDMHGVHEFNQGVRGSFPHKDGWGGAAYNQFWHTTKSLDAFNQQRAKDLLKLSPKALLLHARRATRGRKALENTHPFVTRSAPTALLMHNGTVKEHSFITKTAPMGETDSEMLFLALNEAFNEDLASAIQTVKKQIAKFSGLNFVYATDDAIHCFVHYTERPQYYTMYLSRDDGGLVISSEQLHGKTAHPLPNNTLITIPLKDKNINYQQRLL